MKKSIFHYALGLMNNQNEGSLLKSLDNVHHKGLFSLVIGGNENGSLTRVFIATKKIKMSAIQLHSYTYDLSIGVIKGEFMHHTAMQLGCGAVGANSIKLDKYRYRSPLNGGNGLEFLEDATYLVQSSNIPEGGEVLLSHTDIHSVSVSKGAMWVLQEHGFKTHKSIVLGRKFITDGLYTIPKQYQVNDMWQKVYASLKKLTHGQEQNNESSD